MQFIRADVEEGIRSLSNALIQPLAKGKRTLWLISGGSNIALTAQVMAMLPKEITKRLTLMPVDERYGPLGHDDSNIHQLIDTCRDFKHASLVPVLTNEDLDTTLERYAQNAQHQFKANSCIITQLGMGADCHIAGILPNSPATQARPNLLAVGYKWSDHTRLTLTFQALARAQATFVFAYGSSKHQALEQLRDQNQTLAIQPAQFLKQLPQVYIYNDHIDSEG